MIFEKYIIRKIILLFVFFSAACFQLCSAQNPQHKIDSLLQVLKRAREDTTKVNTLIVLGWELRNSNPDTSIILANQALSLSKKAASKKHIAISYSVIAEANYVKGNYPSALDNNLKALSLREELADKSEIVKSLSHIGNFYSRQGDYSNALDYSFKALKIYEELGNKNGIANSLLNIGDAYFRQGEYPKALDYLFKSLKMQEELGNKNRISASLGNIGNVYLYQSDYPKALDYYVKSLKMDEELGDKDGIANKLNNIGNVYSDQGDYPKALDYLFKALKMREQLGDKAGIATTLGNIGNVYLYQSDNPKALDYYFKALKMLEELGVKVGFDGLLGNIGIIYDNQKDNPKALDYHFKALKMSQELGNKNGIANHLGNIGSVYYKQKDYPKALNYHFKSLKISEELRDKNNIAISLGNIGLLYAETGKFLEAEEYLKKANAILDSIGAMGKLWHFEEQLSQLYDTTGRYKLALEHYKKAMVLKDTLFNQEKNKEITRKEMNYEFEKTQAIEKAEHEKQLAVADVEIKKQKVLKYSFIGGLALTILLFFFGYRFYRARQIMRLQTIRNHIADDLHDDIGSTLNSISVYSEVAKQKSPAVVQELEQIGEASRKIIDAMSDIVWTINTKNDSFEQIILRLRSLAYNLLRAKNIEHTFRADESLNGMKLSMEHRRNFYLIFKEALNNLVKYSNATRVSISLTHENNFITLTIRDNGIGFDAKQTSTGNGLLSMKSRAEEMKAELKIESELGSGTSVELKLKS